MLKIESNLFNDYSPVEILILLYAATYSNSDEKSFSISKMAKTIGMDRSKVRRAIQKLISDQPSDHPNDQPSDQPSDQQSDHPNDQLLKDDKLLALKEIANFAGLHVTNKVTNRMTNKVTNKMTKDLAQKEVANTTAKSIGLEGRNKEFYNSLIPYVAQYGKHMIREFYNYWSEPNKSQTKMRFEMEKTWSLERRLARWFNNNNTNKAYGKSGNDNQSVQRRQDEVQGLIDELLAEDEANRNNQE